MSQMHSPSRLRTLGLFFSALLFVGCDSAKPKQAEDWWSKMTTPGKTIVHVLHLAPRESKPIVIQGTECKRLGVLVREVVEMRKKLEETNEDGGVFLIQNGTGRYIGTYYSAGNLFDLRLGTTFTVENRSPVSTDVIVFSDPKL